MRLASVYLGKMEFWSNGEKLNTPTVLNKASERRALSPDLYLEMSSSRRRQGKERKKSGRLRRSWQDLRAPDLGEDGLDLFRPGKRSPDVSPPFLRLIETVVSCVMV